MAVAEPSAPPPSPAPPRPVVEASRGFWRETWNRFRRRKLAMSALAYVALLSVVALTAPMIVGTKPVVCYYEGSYYFPCWGYFSDGWENVVFKQGGFRRIRFAESLRSDPNSWALWPLVYQDPYRRIRAGEFVGVPENERNGSPPNRFNLFGSDAEGIDVFAQMVHAAKTALSVGFVSMGIAGAIGISIGATAGYLGGWVDMLISRLIEVVMCIPTLILILAMIAIVEVPSIWHIMAVIGVTGWTGIARLTRAEFIKLKHSDFVTAAEALGAGRFRIMARHILPNALAPVLVPITFGIASAILIESTLSFLGFGPQGSPSWGKILNEAPSHLGMWWLVVFPGGAIFLAVLAYNLIGEGLQEATDPRLRGAGR
jgi:peptide/nickel transport system permease protein